MKYEDGLASKKKDDGINRCLLAAITPGSTENPEVLNGYVETMNIRPGDYLLCGDFKIINIACGLMSHSARYPCFACHWVNGSDVDASEARTFEGIQANF